MLQDPVCACTHALLLLGPHEELMVAALHHVQRLVGAADAVHERLVAAQGGALVAAAVLAKHGQRELCVPLLQGFHGCLDLASRTHAHRSHIVQRVIHILLSDLHPARPIADAVPDATCAPGLPQAQAEPPAVVPLRASITDRAATLPSGATATVIALIEASEWQYLTGSRLEV